MAQVPPLPLGPSAGVPGSVPNQLSIETTVQQERDLAQPGVRPDGMFARSRARPTASATVRAAATAWAACSSPSATISRTSLGSWDAACEASEKR